MATLQIDIPTAEALRIKAAQEYRGFTGTNAEHLELLRQRVIRHARAWLLSVEQEMAEESRVTVPVNIT